MRLASAILAILLGALFAGAAPVQAAVERRLPAAPRPAPAPAARFIDRSFITSDGVRLHYVEGGRGIESGRARTIVFVPGWSMPGWIWDRQMDVFARRYHVIAFDPRAQGTSDIAPSGYDHVRRGEDIAELLATVGPEPVVIVAWSLGVLDTLAYLRAQGDRKLAGLVLVDNSIGENPPPTSSGVPARRGPKLSREAAMHNFVRGMFARPPAPLWVDRLTQSALRVPEWAASALLSYPVPRSYWRDAVYSTTRPLLYVVRPRFEGQAGNLALNYPGAETAVWRDVGHALFVDDAPRFNALVQSFVARRVWP